MDGLDGLDDEDENGGSIAYTYTYTHSGPLAQTDRDSRPRQLTRSTRHSRLAIDSWTTRLALSIPSHLALGPPPSLCATFGPTNALTTGDLSLLTSGHGEGTSLLVIVLSVDRRMQITHSA
jgi:hypothetical protein